MSLIQVSNLTFAYEGSYDPIFENVSFQIDTNWRLGFTGRNGRGKTTFLNLLLGRFPYHGSISASVSFSYFPYEIPDKTQLAIDVVEEIYPDYQYWQLAKEMNLLQLEEEALYRPFGTLSNGEQTKLMLAVLFLRENNFLLIDEPTNHLDIQGRELVSRYLKSKKGFILVSHDRAFLDGCVDHILSINKANIEVCRGNFSTWYENKQRQDAFELSENEKLKRVVKVARNASIALAISLLLVFWGFTGMKDAFLPDISEGVRSVIKWIALITAVLSFIMLVFALVARHNGRKHVLKNIDRYQGKA